MLIATETDLSRLQAEGRVVALSVETNIFGEKALKLNAPVLQTVVRLKDRRLAFILSGTVALEILRHLEDATECLKRSADLSRNVELGKVDVFEPEDYD